jgi:protein PhnA
MLNHDEEYIYDEASGTYVPASELASASEDDAASVTRDSVGSPLADGDDVHVIKDLKVGGSSLTLKRGEVIKNIRLVEGDSTVVECRIGKATLVLKTEFLKKK